MTSRIYLILLATALAVTGIASFYAYSWLGSIGDPRIALDSYVYHSTFGWMIAWITFIILAAYTLFLVWKNGARWAVWTTAAYFVLSIVLLTYNDSVFASFLEKNLLTTDRTLLNPFFAGVILVIAVLALMVAQVIVMSFRPKTKEVVKEETVEQSDSEE